MKRIGILGGCFNPVHAGHIRLALEALEGIGLERVDLVPCFSPPHKDEDGLLGFGLRSELVRQAIDAISGLRVDTIEEQLETPSYTWRTLAAYHEREPEADLFFILGAGDLLALPRWKQGPDLVRQANFVVAPRAGLGRQEVEECIAGHWPEAERLAHPLPGSTAAWRFAPASGNNEPTFILLLPIPALDISSSHLRELWRQGRSLHCLTPWAVSTMLLAREQDVAATWGPRRAHRP